MKSERIIKIRTPYDKRSANPYKNYGIGSLMIRFILKKGEKAVQIIISTNSYLYSVIEEYKTKFPEFNNEGDYEGYSCHDVGYHSNVPHYPGQAPMI